MSFWWVQNQNWSQIRVFSQSNSVHWSQLKLKMTVLTRPSDRIAWILSWLTVCRKRTQTMEEFRVAPRSGLRHWRRAAHLALFTFSILMNTLEIKHNHHPLASAVAPVFTFNTVVLACLFIPVAGWKMSFPPLRHRQLPQAVRWVIGLHFVAGTKTIFFAVGCKQRA